jgi:hypothetical protein
MDFRDGTIPGNVEIVGEAASEFIFEPSGSSALKLHPGTFLKINCPFKNGVGGKLINEYTLTMDVMFDSLPSDSSVLLQTSGRLHH